ncbi:MotA/TolQ/ExbB proton channel family protein [bacterium]|nr:MotA/TolQ/ExbB proton channel family protein [bacterium]
MTKTRLRKKLSFAFYSLLISTSLSCLLALGYYKTLDSESLSALNRFFILFGGNFLNGGYIQFLTFFAFFWCLLEIKAQLRFIQKERKTLRKNYLPVKKNHILLSNDIAEIYHRMNDIDKRKRTLLTELIKKACSKFRTNRSIGEMMDLVSIQVEINKERSESEQSNIRYLNWGIPSLGFIGTVMGISASLKYANSGDMETITSLLGVAFDTTLISLILSIIVMWFLHFLQEETDYLHTGMKEYVLDNLVNRIEF